MRPIFLTRTQRLGIALRGVLSFVGTCVVGACAGLIVAGATVGLVRLLGAAL